MKKSLTALFIFAISNIANAQYYYKDILNNKQITADLNAYKENKVRKIFVKSFEDDGKESEGFFCEKKISKNYKSSELFTRVNFSTASLFKATYDDAARLISTYDSSELSITEIRYSYDKNNQLESVLSSIRSKDEDFENGITEEHIYSFEKDVVKSMQKIKNSKDTINILFTADENGNIILEKDTKTASKYYYYYDNKNRLTDIVPESQYSKSLKPDYIFEYNNANQITQMTSVEEGSSKYFIWKYSYANGLRIKERCYGNDRRSIGSIEYEYK